MRSDKQCDIRSIRFQMAGVGGNGGNGNAAIGGDAGLHSSIWA
jgi:hypothetical protein